MTTNGGRAQAQDPRRHGVVAAVATILFFGFAAGGAAVSRNVVVAYRSDEILTINQPALIATSRDAGPIAKLSGLRLQYSELIGTAVIDDAIAARARVTPSYVARTVTVEDRVLSLLIDLRADARTPALAESLAAAAGDTLVDYAASTQAQNKVPESDRIVLSVVTPATAAKKVTPALRTVATVGLFLGAVAAAMVYAFAALARARRR